MTPGSQLPGELATLAAGLCQDGQLDLEVGAGWSWDPARRVLTVDRAELQRRGAAYCAGIVAHEVGHVLISRYLSFPLDFPSLRAGMTALNGIEDPRVEQWSVGRFPGAGPWLAAGRGEAHPSMALGSGFITFCLECAAEGQRGYSPTPGRLPPGVAAALEATRDARRRYSATTPATSLSGDLPDLQAHYAAEVQPNLTGSPWPPSRREQAVRLFAWRAHCLAVAEILPVARGLFEADRDRLARSLRRNPAAAQLAQAQVGGAGGPWSGLAPSLGGDLAGGSDQSETDDARAGATTGLSEAVSQQLATALLEQAMGARAHRPMLAGEAPTRRRGRAQTDAERRRAVDDAARKTRATAPLEVPQSSAPYDVAYRHVAEQVDRLVRHLEDVLQPRKRLRRRSGYASGQRLDLRRVMSWEADPTQWDRLWTRTTIPERREVAIGLLVDLSGSMSGAPANHALLGTVLLAETLHRLQVPFAIDGFQDVLIPLHDFDDPLDAAVRSRIAEMPLEVDGCRPGGHNQPGYNDDGPCLIAFAEKVLDRAANDRVVVVLSDGEPAGRRSSAEDLHSAVAQLSGGRMDGQIGGRRLAGQQLTGLRLIGLGLGPGTEHVRTFYPEHEANVPLTELSDRIGALLERVLIG